MYKKIAKYVLAIAIIVIIVSAVVMVYGITNKKSREDKTGEKVIQEIDYLEQKLSEVLLNLNNLNTNNLINSEIKINQSENQSPSSSQKNNESSKGTSTSPTSEAGASNTSSSNNQKTATISAVDSKSILQKDRSNINWKYIQTEIEEVRNSWSIVLIDLNSIDKSNENILKFNTILDDAMKAVKANDKIKTLGYVANLYELFPQYMKLASEDTQKIEYINIKSDILSSYALIEMNQWDNVYNLLSDADKRLSNIMNNPNKSSNTQKVYVLLKDYIKSANDKDVELCYVKLYYLMQELENV